jgi:hypothetical protein
MIQQEVIPLNQPSKWKQALEGIEHGFGHTWENCHAMHLTTGYATYLYRFAYKDVLIVCPIAERRYDQYLDIVTPYGFSGFTGNPNYSEFQRHWWDFVRQKGYVCGYIALNPLFEQGSLFPAHEVYQSNSLYFLNLTPTLDELYNNFDRNRKRQLRNWEDISSQFIFDRSTLTEFFITHYDEFIQRINAPPASHFSHQTLSHLCSLDNVFMVGAGNSQKIEAVYLFGYTPYAGDCLFNVSLLEGRHYATSLLWCGVQHLKSRHIPWLNMGGGIREDDSIAQSKQRFGACKKPFRYLKQVYRPEIYVELCQRVNANPYAIKGYFPAFQKP